MASIAIIATLASLTLAAPGRAAEQRIAFARGASSATVAGTVAPDADGMLIADYRLGAAAGQTLTVRLDSAAAAAELLVFCPGDGQSDAIAPRGGSFTLPQSGDYRLRITSSDVGADARGFAFSLTAAVTGKPHVVPAPALTGTYVRGDRNRSQVEVQAVAADRIEFRVLAFHGNAPNIGDLRAVASRAGRHAHYEHTGEPDNPRAACKLDFDFEGETLRVAQDGDCDFGAGVDATGSYHRESLCSAPRYGAEPGDL